MTNSRGKHLFDCWDRLKGNLANKNILLLLDYDGTLTPIVETPDQAVLSQEVKEILVKLSKVYSCHLVIVTGRALPNIKKMVGIKGITYTGNHGFEIEGSDIHFESPVAPRYKELLYRIKADLEKRLSPIEGVWLEDKRITLSLHYRRVDEKNIKLLEKIFTSVCRPHIKDKEIEIQSGKKVFEIKPPIAWDKGQAALWLLAKWENLWGKDNLVSMYIGDDIADEEAFKLLKDKSLTVSVGENARSSAIYYLKNPQEVTQLLKGILELKRA